MNKFDIEYNKILKQQNLIQQADIITPLKNLWNATGGKAVKYVKKGVSTAWNSISEIGSSISNAISKGIKWGINKIRATLQNLWNAITPNNAEQTVHSLKNLIKIMPDKLAEQSQLMINTAQSEQFKIYLAKQIQANYKSIDNFNALSNTEQKEFIKKTANTFLNNNKIVSQEIIDEGITFLLSMIVFLIAYFIIKDDVKAGIKYLNKSPGQKEIEDKTEQAKAQYEYDKAAAAHEQWKTDQQRKKIFRQIINVKSFL